jgi:hypothetical protein
MTGNPVYDLLDSVSSGGPTGGSLSVDDLVRGGRRRQRGVAFVATGTTAGVVTVAVTAALLAVPGSRRPSASPGASNPAGPSSPAPAATALVPLNGPVGAAIPITAANILEGGTQVTAFAETVACAGPAEATVVSQTDTQVVLSLRFGKGSPAATMSHAPVASDAPHPACTARPSVVTEVPGAEGTIPGSYVFALSAALGSRRLIDAGSGRTIPYTTAEQFAEPTWVPAGFRQMGMQPTDRRVWEEFWTSREGGFTLAETYNVADAVSGANRAVNGRPARFQSDQNSLEWVANGRLFELAAPETGACQAGTSTADTPCVVVSHLPTVSEADLLRIADSIPTS